MADTNNLEAGQNLLGQPAVTRDKSLEMVGRVQLLYKNSPIVLVGVPAVSLVTVMFFWSSQPHATLVSWFTLNLILVAIRGFLYWRFQAAPNHEQEAPFWGRIYTVFSVISGIIWGLLPWLILDTGSTIHVLVLMLILFGMVAGSLASHAPFFPAYAGFAIPTVLLLSARLLMEGGEYLVLSLLLIAFLIVNLGYAWNHRKLIIEVIHQRIKNDALLNDVVEKHQLAEQASRDKSRLLAATSHDLRQPLHALDLFLGSLRNRLKATEDLQVLAQAEACSEALRDLLNSLLDMSRLDAGQVKVSKKLVPLSHILDECMAEFTPVAKAKGLDLRLKILPGSCVNSDPVLLARVIRNFLSNAIRYTHDGGILLAARHRGSNIRIEVWDTGKGIDAEKKTHIFDEFYQIGNPERDREKGLGLGLAIVRRLSALLDHSIDVRSRIGRGSCFAINVPACDASDLCSEPLEPAASQGSLAGLFVLVVDDHPAILNGMRELLRGWDCEVLMGRDGREILDALKADNYPPPDVMLVDYRLRGDETGDEIIQTVRDFYGLDIAAILMTGEATKEVEKIAAEINAEVVRKPVSADVLKNILYKYMPHEGE